MITYTKLKSGEWGIRSTDPVQAGDTVTVSLKSGATKQERITRVLWSGGGVSLCAVAQRSRRPRESGCSCSEKCCKPRCRCDSSCNCNGGPIYNC